MEVYCLDKDGIIWPLILWPYSLEADGQLDSHMRVLNGYQVDDADEEWVLVMDPWSGERWETYDTWASKRSSASCWLKNGSSRAIMS